MIELSARVMFGHLFLGITLLGCTDTKSPIEKPKDESQVEVDIVYEPDLSSSPLVVSEIVSKSNNDSYLEGNDWVELLNLSSEPVYLGDYFLADSGSGLVSLPPVTLAAGEYFVIAAVDSEIATPEYPSVPFKLGSEDVLYLYLDNELVDTMQWFDGDSDEGSAYGLVGSERRTTIPTPGAVNQVAPVVALPSVIITADAPLLVSEIVAKSDDEGFLQGGDWIEFYNSGDIDVNLSDYSVADSRSDKIGLPNQWLGPDQYLVVAAVDTDEQNPPFLSVPFKLGSEDSVLLYLGDDLVSGLRWQSGDAVLGSSYGFIDGEQQTLTPTPAAANLK